MHRAGQDGRKGMKRDRGKGIEIVVLVDGITEKAFKPFLIKFLKGHLERENTKASLSCL